ncbi:MAG: FAD-dependent oxidoreductase, partial [Candidatus Cloacimonadaceae bacterium]
GVEYLFNKRKIPVMINRVTAVTKSDDRFILKLENAEDISSDYVILATGSAPKELPKVKINEQNILSSTGILKMESLPKSLAVIGGGVVGCEFASIFSTLGVEVHLVEFLPTIVSTEDEEIAKRLQFFLKKSGIKIRTGVGVESYRKDNDKVVLKLSDESELEVEKVLLSVGRSPVINIDFGSLAPETNRGAVTIDNFMRTSVQRLYAIGDVTGKLPLAHTASKQGLIVAAHIQSFLADKVFGNHELIYENIPRCTFTHPEVSSCGLTEKQASEQFTNIKVGRFPFTANGKALAGGDTNGFVKTIARADTNQLVGMHIIGPNAAELIAQGSILINLEVTAEQVEKVVFAHPTLSEAVMEAVEDLSGLSIHKM